VKLIRRVKGNQLNKKKFTTLNYGKINEGNQQGAVIEDHWKEIPTQVRSFY
jgi:hypothetical protein